MGLSALFIYQQHEIITQLVKPKEMFNDTISGFLSLTFRLNKQFSFKIYLECRSKDRESAED